MISKDSRGLLDVYYSHEEDRESMNLIVDNLIMPVPKKVSIDKAVDDNYWFRFLLYNLIMKQYTEKEDFHSIILPESHQFYSMKYLAAHPYLLTIFGGQGINYARASRLRTKLFHTCCDSTPGEWMVRCAKLTILPMERWKLKEGSLYVVSEAIRDLTTRHDNSAPPKSHEPAICQSKGGGNSAYIRKALPLMAKLVNGINATYPEGHKRLFKTHMVFGTDESQQCRLYSEFTHRPSASRKEIAASFGWEESDMKSAAWHILYLIHTGKKFHSDRFGEDLYADVAYRYFGNEEQARTYRAVFKAVLAKGIGDNQTTHNGKMRSMLNELARMGAVPNGTIVREHKGRGNWAPTHLHEWTLDNRWEDFASKNGITAPRLIVDINNLIEVVMTDTVLSTAGWSKGYISTQWVETLANIMLYRWAKKKGIIIATLHDAVYGPKEYIHELGEKQWEFVTLAAGVYSKILTHQHEVRMTSTYRKIKQNRRKEIAEDCLSDLPLDIAYAYTRVVVEFFLPTKTPVQIKRKKAFLEARKANIKMEAPMPKKTKVIPAADPTYQAHIQSLPNAIVDESPATEEVEQEVTPLFVEKELELAPVIHPSQPLPSLKDHWFTAVVEDRQQNGWPVEQGTRGAVKTEEVPFKAIDEAMATVKMHFDNNPNTRFMHGIEDGNEDQLPEDLKRAICEKYGVEYCAAS